MSDLGPPSSSSGWGEYLAELDEKHSRAHDRLRMDIREMEKTIESNYRHFADVAELHRAKLGTLESATAQPVDATKLVMPIKATIAIVGSAIVIVASIWNLSTKIDAQQRSAEAAAKIEDAQLTTLRDQISSNQRNTELLRYEMQQLKETMLSKGKGKQP